MKIRQPGNPMSWELPGLIIRCHARRHSETHEVRARSPSELVTMEASLGVWLLNHQCAQGASIIPESNPRDFQHKRRVIFAGCLPKSSEPPAQLVSTYRRARRRNIFLLQPWPHSGGRAPGESTHTGSRLQTDDIRRIGPLGLAPTARSQMNRSASPGCRNRQFCRNGLILCSHAHRHFETPEVHEQRSGREESPAASGPLPIRGNGVRR